jgi:diguanylate cyclase (GGDEF)-like protein
VLGVETETGRRASTVVTYLALVPLTAAIELADGGWSRHPLLILTALAVIGAQTVAAWGVRPMPMHGWLGLLFSISIPFALVGYASPAAGPALAVVLVVPIGWAAIFVAPRPLALTVALNIAAVSTPLIAAPSAVRWGIFLVQAIAFIVLTATIHSAVTALRRAQQVAEHRSDTDATTGLLARARARDILGRMDDRPGRLGTALLLVDIDHFKAVNDAYGHLAGDDALRQVASALRGMLREDDLIARWGGEEFLVAPGEIGDAAALLALAEKLRRGVAARALWVDGHAVTVTISVGAVVGEERTSLRALIAAADDALYQAKRAGRNQVRLAHPNISQLTIPADASNLAAVRRAVRFAAERAGLGEDVVTDITLAANEACAHLLLQRAPSAHPLRVTTHDREHQFAVSVSNHAPIEFTSPDRDALDIAILTNVADHLQADPDDAGSELTMVFAK